MQPAIKYVIGRNGKQQARTRLMALCSNIFPHKGKMPHNETDGDIKTAASLSAISTLILLDEIVIDATLPRWSLAWRQRLEAWLSAQRLGSFAGMSHKLLDTLIVNAST